MQLKASNKAGQCGCGRSPTGQCIGWHALSEEELKEAQKAYSENPGMLKGIPGTLRKRIPIQEEINKAKESIYYQWYRCLNASKDYIDCCKVEGKNHKLSGTYQIFGDVTSSWPRWWQKVGRVIFSERRQYPKVRAIDKSDALNKLQVDSSNFLILDIPLSLRRVTILEQINKLLDENHPGRDLDINAQSSAIVQIESSKLQHKTIPLLVDVAHILLKKPDISLYSLAEEAKIATHHLGRSTSESLSEREEKQRREKAAGDYKKWL